MFEFWKMLGGAYQQCIDQFRAGNGGAINVPSIKR